MEGNPRALLYMTATQSLYYICYRSIQTYFSLATHRKPERQGILYIVEKNYVYINWSVMEITQLFKLAVQKNASDLHLSAGMVPLLRLEGDIQRCDLPVLEDKEIRVFCLEIMTAEQRKKFAAIHEVDFSFEVSGLARFRVNVFEQNRGISAVFRHIAMQVPSLDRLQAPSVLKEISTYSNGLVLVTGPTGSGKSTTLAAMIDYINTHRAAHIITIEDPIEFVHHSKKSLITQREVLRDTKNFGFALRSALREDPDIIFIGELRDLESTQLALTAAETGHLVLATLHTRSAMQTIDRLVDIFPGNEKSAVRALLSESLRAVISQNLIKPLQGGRVAAFEIMLATPAIRHLVREGKTAQMYSVMQTNAAIGMQTLEQHMQELSRKQYIEKQHIKTVVENKEFFTHV